MTISRLMQTERSHTPGIFFENDAAMIGSCWIDLGGRTANVQCSCGEGVLCMTRLISVDGLSLVKISARLLNQSAFA